MKNINPEKVKKILFITLSNIGDAILTTPCLDLVSRKFSNAAITVLVSPRAREVFEGNPRVSQIMIYDKYSSLKKRFSLIRALRKERFDLAIDLRHTLIPFLIGCRYSTPFFRKRGEGHAVRQHLQCLKSLGIEGPITFSLPSLDREENFVKELLIKHGINDGEQFIVIGPGAAYYLKRWDLEKFKALAEALKAKKKIPIIIVGSIENRQSFIKAFPENQWINFTGQLTLMQLGALLKRARLFITNDSGPIHLAAALKTPVLAIFGPTDPEIYGPYGDIHKIVRLELPCSPCMKGHCQIETQKCLKDLSVECVFDVANGMFIK